MSRARVRVVVPSERHVERLSREGADVETRGALRERLLEALAPDVSLADAATVRAALVDALADVAKRDALLAPIARAGGPAWLRTVDAVDSAIGALRDAAVGDASLAGRAPAPIAARVRLLHGAMRALDVALERRGLVDARRSGALLAATIEDVDPERVRAALGADAVVARWILAWDAADVAWWRALDAALRRTGGSATIELPAIERPLDAEREAGPLEIVADELARALDDAPALAPIAAPLGELSFAAPLDATLCARVGVRRGVDAEAQARAVVAAVLGALDAGTAADAIAIAAPQLDEETLGPIARALDDAGVVVHAPDLRPRSGLVACAFDALTIASRGLRRRDVAALLRSRFLGEGTLGVARADAVRLARALEQTPTVSASDRVSALEATARVDTDDAATLARTVATALVSVDAPRTRAGHVDAARALFAALGIAPRVHGDAAAALRDDGAARGLGRAALRAFADDARAWAALDRALAAVARASSATIDADAFVVELAHAIVVAPVACAAGAVRIAPLHELAGEPLALLVVVDANDGVLPSAGDEDGLFGDAIAVWLRGGEGMPPSQLRRARHLASLAAAASAASRIVFVDRERDDAAALLAPAPVVAWLERSGVKAERVSSSPLAGALTEREARLRALAGGAETDRARLLSPDAARRASIERAREALFESRSPARTEVRGELAPDAARAAILAAETGGADRAMSVTALERIATCPFAGFASQVLRARDEAAIDETPRAREAGTLAHDALAAAFEATAELWAARPRDRDAIVSRALAAADALFERAPAASSLRRLELARVREDVAAVLEWSLADENWDFAHAEKGFGAPGDDWPAVVIDDAERVALRGQIDRVDLAHGRAAISAIDYKRSESTATAATKRLGDTSFQVAIYARAAARAAGATESEGAYVPTAARAVARFDRASGRERWAAAHADAAGMPAIDRRALDVVVGLRRGSVVPSPAYDGACEACPYDGGCRKPRFAMRADDEEGEER